MALMIDFLFSKRINWCSVCNCWNWARGACIIVETSLTSIDVFLYGLHRRVFVVFQILCGQLFFMRKHVFFWLLILFCMFTLSIIILVEVAVLIFCIVAIMPSPSILAENVEVWLCIPKAQRLRNRLWHSFIWLFPIRITTPCFLLILTKSAVSHCLYLVWRRMPHLARYC